MPKRTYKYIAVSEDTFRLIRDLMSKTRINTYDKFIKFVDEKDIFQKNDVSRILIEHKDKYVTEKYIFRKMRRISASNRTVASVKSRLNELVDMGFIERVKGVYYIYRNRDTKNRKSFPVKLTIWSKLSINKIRINFGSIEDLIIYMIIKNYDKLLNREVVVEQNGQSDRLDISSSV